MSGLATYQFDTSIFEAATHDIVKIDGKLVRVGNIQVTGFPVYDPTFDTTFPVFFEVTGKYYHYVVQVWDDKVEIEVYTLDVDGYTLRSTMRPRNQSELLQALATIYTDYKNKRVPRIAA